MAAAAGAGVKFEGLYTALVTPFHADESVAWDEYDNLVQRQIDGGVDGLVICGTTAESPTLTKEEKHRLVERAIEMCKGKCLVIAGTGSNCTATTVAETQWAKDAGADGCLLVNPYYNKPQQAGLIRHVKAVAAVGLPIMLYNVPGRTACKMDVDTILELAKLPEVVSIKDATGALDTVSAIAAVSDFPLLSGDDPLTLPMMSLGACGVVSVTSNVSPELMGRIVRAAQGGDMAAARAAHLALVPLFAALFCEVNPVPVKYALHAMGVISTSAVRSPLAPIAEASKPPVDAALAACGLVEA